MSGIFLRKITSFLHFQEQYASTRSVFESISQVHMRTSKNDGNDSIPYRACVMPVVNVVVVNDLCMTSSFWKTSVFVRPLITGSWVRNLRYGGRNCRLRVDEKKISIFKKYPVGFGTGLSISLNRELFKRSFFNFFSVQCIINWWRSKFRKSFTRV